MATVSPTFRPYFHLRLGVALLSLAGFWVCLGRVDWGRTESAAGAGSLAGGSRASDSRAGSGIQPPADLPHGPAQPPPDLPEPVVMIDPGHGGMDGGTVGNGLIEKDWTLKVGLALAAELKKRGHKVALTREDDSLIPVLERPALINAAPRIALISIHFNAGAGDASGVETWYSWPKKPEVMARLHDAEGRLVAGAEADDGQRLAQAVQTAVQARTGARDRGIKNREDLAITSRTVCPAVLIECGFLSNGTESRRIQDAAYRKKLVEGLAEGYEAWLESRRAVPVIASPAVELPAAPAGAAGSAAAGPADAEH